MATAGQKNKFIAQIAPLIQKHASERGYAVASPIIAQACLESRYGDSELARKHHNYFGLKCGSQWKGRYVNMKTQEEYKVGVMTSIRDSFRAYDSIEEGVKGYFDFIAAKRYANLKTASTPRRYLELIKADGYATASDYVESNMRIVTSCGLTAYDGPGLASVGTSKAAATSNPYHEPSGTIRLNSQGTGARWLQSSLNRFGYRLTVDGIAGKKTIAALMDFQRRHTLIADGICGIRTKAALREPG